MDYVPRRPPADNLENLALYIEDELQSLVSSLNEPYQNTVLYVAPSRPRTGLVVYADGTNWNPGNGEGYYVYTSGAVWSFLGGTTNGTGGGGTVTQATSKATTVVLNKASGEITLNNAALAAATIVSFTLTNSAIGAHDTLNINHVLTGTIGAYTFNAVCAAGSATIYVRNATAGSLSEAIVLRFNLLKGAST